jgi:hypothetical protein
VTGRVVISSCSLANVTIEPENEIAPTRIVNAVAIAATVSPSCTSPSSISATSDAAPPPTPLNSATSCGMCVICTRRDPTTPPTVPITSAIRIGTRLSGLYAANVMITARTAPAAPSALPVRAVFGDDSALSATMKQTAAIR